MTEVETLLSDAAFTRPTSLYLPERTVQSALVDSSSYTPFPSFPGSSRARDPFGLNAFLLPPDDKSWHYIDPTPAPVPASSRLDGGSSTTSSAPDRRNSLRKQRSMSLLPKPSPLSQPPLELPPIQRRRSNSVGSQGSASESKASQPVVDEDFAPQQRAGSKATGSASSKKSLKSSLFRASKSMFRNVEMPPAAPPPSSTASSSPTAERHSDESDSAVAGEVSTTTGTPKSSRSNSTFSTLSSASSVSSDGPHTPNEGAVDNQDGGVTGAKLADALAGAAAAAASVATDVPDKRKGWKSWLAGNKRGPSRLTAPAISSPLAISPASSPVVSKLDLIAPTAAELDPPSRVGTPPSRSQTASPGEQLSHSWVGESLRRASLRKVQALRRPSPHPLAMHLRRQHCPLPDEVAFSLQAGLRMFPKSVNSPSAVLTPNQGGLATTLAIKSVLKALDAGQLPVGTLSSRRGPVESSGNLRPRGITDFIRRAPFEDRMTVYYPDGRYSPVSTARPGFALWDLDFSPYVQALAELDRPFSRRPSSAGETLRAPPFSSSDEMLAVPPMVDEVDGAVGDESAEVLVTPPLDDVAPSAATDDVPADSAALPDKDALPARALPDAASSFRKARKEPVTWLDSESEASSEEDEDDDDDDNAPLSRPSMPRSSTGQELKTRASSLSVPGDARSAVALPRSLSTPAVDLLAPRRSAEQARPRASADKRASHMSSAASKAQEQWDEKRQQQALAEVVRARQRRVANHAGEAEKRAEAEARVPLRSAMKGRRSNPNVSVLPAAVAPERGADPRRRSTSTLEPTPQVGRSPKRVNADLGKATASRRYHSFYDLPAAGSPEQPPASHSPPRASMVPLPPFHHHPQSYPVPVFAPQAFHPGFVLPAPVPAVTGLSASASMQFPPAASYGQFPRHSMPALAPTPANYMPHSSSMNSLALGLHGTDRRSAPYHRSTRAS